MYNSCQTMGDKFELRISQTIVIMGLRTPPQLCPCKVETLLFYVVACPANCATCSLNDESTATVCTLCNTRFGLNGDVCNGKLTYFTVLN